MAPSQMIPQHFPSLPQFSHFMKPSRFEGETNYLEVIGTIPPEVRGTFYRVMPDPHLPSRVEDDPWFNGDGNVSAFRIESGKVHFKQRYVRTEKFIKECEAGRALLGKYRNKFTDAIEFTVRTTANTNIVFFNGKLLACKEDALPYEMDPVTLETIGLYDFNGQLPSLTFTAHPKLDPVTKEFIGFGYEAKGDGTPDICYFSVDPSGKFTDLVWLVSPVVAMIHDFAVLFPLIPHTCDLERMKAGGEHWQWTPDIPLYIGVLPRRGAQSSDIKWFRAPNASPGHTSNAFEKNGKIFFDLPVGKKNVFFWWPDSQGNAPSPQEVACHLSRFIIDPSSDNLELQPAEILSSEDVEFPRIDERFLSREHNHAFFCLNDVTAPTIWPTVVAKMGGGHPVYNSIGRLNLRTRQFDKYFPGNKHLVQETVFIPRSSGAAEGEGYLLFLVNNYETMLSELHLVDTDDFTRPLAVILLPLRLRQGLHGNWVDDKDLKQARY
ncbi:lignostilbene dioxygenase, partial [Aspergillus niger ATCC 13496]